MQHASRGWFEDDDFFEARVKSIRETFTAKLKTKPQRSPGSYAAAVTSATTASSAIRRGAPIPSSSKGVRGSPSISVVGTSSATSNTPTKSSNWVTPGQDNRKNAWGTADKKKKKKNKGSGVFAAMMANDDSDSDVDDDNDVEHDSDDEQEATATTPTKGAATTADDSSPAADNSSKKKKGKKKKSKGGGKKKKDEANMTEDELLNASVAANKALEKEKEESEEVSHPAIAFLKNYLIPFILGFITFIFSDNGGARGYACSSLCFEEAHCS